MCICSFAKCKSEMAAVITGTVSHERTKPPLMKSKNTNEWQAMFTEVRTKFHINALFIVLIWRSMQCNTFQAFLLVLVWIWRTFVQISNENLACCKSWVLWLESTTIKEDIVCNGKHWKGMHAKIFSAGGRDYKNMMVLKILLSFSSFLQTQIKVLHWLMMIYYNVSQRGEKWRW